jgi:hypothetical protein
MDEGRDMENDFQIQTFKLIDSIAEQAIRSEADIAPLADGELTPLRAISDLCARAIAAITKATA